LLGQVFTASQLEWIEQPSHTAELYGLGTAAAVAAGKGRFLLTLLKVLVGFTQ
jgi:hypothetical protein